MSWEELWSFRKSLDQDAREKLDIQIGFLEDGDFLRVDPNFRQSIERMSNKEYKDFTSGAPQDIMSVFQQFRKNNV